MEGENRLLQKMRRVFSENEDQEKIAEEIIQKVEEGYQKGVLSKREMKMICNIFEYMDEEARDIMTHRKHIVALDGETGLEDAIRFVLEENYSRFPVYEEDIDTIVGMIHLRDLMSCYFDTALKDVKIKELKDYIRPVQFIPETRGIDKLIQEMQRDKCHMVVVLDEYGQTEGIVTMEDIVEEIVGNIQDEYDVEEEMIQQKEDGSYLVDGTTQLSDLEDLLNIQFEEEDYDTINGYLISCLERIPSEDEDASVQFDGYCFKAAAVDGKMIRKVRIEKNGNK